MNLAIWLCLAIVYKATAEIVYVTDLTIFTKLAPCAASALSYAVMSATFSACPEPVTELQSCVCSKDNNFASFLTKLSSSVSYSCGGIASDDQTSATIVYNAYCDQDSITTFAKPATPVSQYITDINAWADLAPCARSALSYAVMSMTYGYCPQDPSLLATCVCNKNQNSLKLSQAIHTSVRSSCASHTADISSAQAVFAGYCGLLNGTSSFPTTFNPPGDMTYYITALEQYSSLAPCAQSALSYGIFYQTYYNCPDGPQALASCACLKDPMPSVISSAVISSVKYSCDSTATEDITSALAVWNYYCSAAKALVTPTGVTESVEQTNAAQTGNGAGSSGPEATGGLGPSSGSRGSNLGPLIGGIVGAVFGIALVAGVAYFLWRLSQARRHKQNMEISHMPHAGDRKPELDNTAIASGRPAGSLSPSIMKITSPFQLDNVSPISPHAYMHSELQGQYVYPPPPAHQHELQGQNTYPAQPQLFPRLNLTGQRRWPTSEVHGSQIYGAPGQNQTRRNETQGNPMQTTRARRGELGWRSGSINSYHEMDAGWSRPGQQNPKQ